MSLLDTIKAAQLQARKDRRSADAAALTTLIGEVSPSGTAAAIGVPDDRVVAALKKFIDGVNVVISHAEASNNAERVSQAVAERALYEQFIPTQLNREQLSAIVAELKTETGAATPRDMGKIMSLLKARYAGQYDGTLASEVVKAALV